MNPILPLLVLGYFPVKSRLALTTSTLFMKCIRRRGSIFVWLEFAGSSARVGSSFVVVGRLLEVSAETPIVPLR